MASVLGTDEESGLKQTLGDGGGLEGSGLQRAGMLAAAQTLAPAVQSGGVSSSSSASTPTPGGGYTGIPRRENRR